MPFSVREGMYITYTVIDGCNFLPFFLAFLFLYSLSVFVLFFTALLVILDSIIHMSAVSAIINIIRIKLITDQ